MTSSRESRYMRLLSLSVPPHVLMHCHHEESGSRATHSQSFVLCFRMDSHSRVPLPVRNAMSSVGGLCRRRVQPLPRILQCRFCRHMGLLIVLNRCGAARPTTFRGVNCGHGAPSSSSMSSVQQSNSKHVWAKVLLVVPKLGPSRIPGNKEIQNDFPMAVEAAHSRKPRL